MSIVHLKAVVLLPFWPQTIYNLLLPRWVSEKGKNMEEGSSSSVYPTTSGTVSQAKSSSAPSLPSQREAEQLLTAAGGVS